MSKHILVGVDIGTTTIKAVFLDADVGKILGTELEEITQIRKKPDWAEYDAFVWWDSVKSVLSRGITNLNIDPESVAGICCCGFTVVRTELSMASLIDEDPYALMEKEAAGGFKRAHGNGRPCQEQDVDADRCRVRGRNISR